MVFLTTSLFSRLLSLLKSTGTVFNLSASILSTSAFKPAKSDFDAKLDVSAPIAFFKSVFIAKLDKFSLTVKSMSPPKGSYNLENYLLIVYNIFFNLSN